MSIFNFFNKKIDKFDERKIAANLFVLKHGSYEVAKSFSIFDEEQAELIKFATKSIMKIDPLGGLPLGFPYEFVAAYPDVVLWWNDLSNNKQEHLFENINENDLFDENNKIRQKHLMVVVNAYKADGLGLECVIDK